MRGESGGRGRDWTHKGLAAGGAGRSGANAEQHQRRREVIIIATVVIGRDQRHVTRLYSGEKQYQFGSIGKYDMEVIL